MKYINRWIKIFTLLLLSTLFGTTVQAGTGAGYSEYYIPGTEQEMYTAFAGLNPAVTDNTMTSFISVVAIADATTVYYDHWEDGYDLDPNDLAGTADEIVILSAGQQQTFTSTDIPVNPRGTAVRYDGGDHIYTVGGPVTISRASLNTGVGSVLGMSWEVYPLKALAPEYIVPFGEDLNTNKGYLDFIRTYFLVTATEDNTQLTIVDPVLGTTTVTINRNVSHLVSNNNAGTTVSSDKPISLIMAVGDNGSNYESRGYTGVPSTFWSDTYYAPVGSFTNADTQVYVYNPNATTLTINYEDKIGAGTFTVAPQDTLSFSDAAAANRFVALNSALALTGDQDFWAVNSIDTRLNVYDWGHSLIPDTFLKSDYLVGWAPGSLDETQNGSPLFATPTVDGTIVYVDYPPTDGIADITYTLNRLDSQKIYNPNINTMSGAHVWSTDPIALVWGQDPDTAGTGSPYLDMGYTTLPQRDEWIDLVLTVDKTANKSVISAKAGETVTFTLVVSTHDTAVSSVNVKDILPTGWSYVSDSTSITLADASTVSGPLADPSISGQTLVWDSALLQDMNASDMISIQFDAITTIDFTPGEVSINQVETNATAGGAIFIATDIYNNYFVGMAVVKTSTPQNIPLLPGDTIDYNIQITNSALAGSIEILNNVVANDIFPEGTTLNSCSVDGWSYAVKTAEDTFPTNGDYSTGTNWATNWTEVDNNGDPTDGGDPAGGDIRVTGNTLRIRDNDKGVERSVDFTGFGTTAQLSFDYQRVGLDNIAAEFVAVQINDGGGFVEVARFDGTTGNDATFQSFGPIAVTIGSTTTIRFISSDSGQGNGEEVYFDNIKLEASLKTAKSIPCNAFNDILTAADDFDLYPGDDLNITYQVTVDDPLASNVLEINNTVSVTTDEIITPVVRKTSDPVTNDADLVTVKTTSTPSPNEGDVVIFMINVKNNGPRIATNVSLTDALPAGITFSSASVTQVDYNTTTNIWTVGTLANGADANLTLTGVVNAGTGGSTLINVTTAAVGDQDDSIATGDDLNETITVKNDTDLSVNKTLDIVGPYIPGQSVTYTLVVSNTGPAMARNVIVTDLPTNLKVTSASGPSSNCTITDPSPAVTTSVVCTITSLAAGLSETILLQAMVP